MKTGAPYWLSYLKHPYNQALSALVLGGSVVASFFYGLDTLALGALGLAAVQIVGLAVVPDRPSFRAAADRYARNADREERRAHLNHLIYVNGGSPHLDRYERMRERVEALARLAETQSNSLTPREVEHLDDLTVEYLNLCLSDAALRRMTDAPARTKLQKQARKFEQRLQSSKLDPVERAEIERAQQAFADIQARQERLQTRHAALQASLAALPMRVEEIYQIVSTAPRAGELSAMVDESLEKLRADEQVDFDLQTMLGTDDPIELLTADLKRDQAQAQTRRAVEARQ